MLDAELPGCIPPSRESSSLSVRCRGSPTQRQAAAARDVPLDVMLADLQGELAKSA